MPTPPRRHPTTPYSPPRPSALRPSAPVRVRPAAKPAPPPPAPGTPRPPNRAKELNSGCPDGYLSTVFPAGLSREEAERKPVLFAIIGTWFEGDVIGACVRNCFANGAAKVFIVDNDSPDDTQAQAVAAGATIAKVYQTPFYDEDLRLRLMNETMAAVSAKEPHPEVWWLSLDADEFPCGPHGAPLLSFIRDLPPRINCVGANAFDLYPTEPPYYEPDKHPADCMSHGLKRLAAKNAFCAQAHWKHPLLRCSYGRLTMAQARGSHRPYLMPDAQKQAIEFPFELAGVTLPMFHAPFRAKEATFRRLEALCGKRPELGNQHRSAGDDLATNKNGAIKRWRSLESVYKGEWDRVEMPHCQAYGKNVVGVALYPWRRILKDVTTFPRWYEVPEAAARTAAPRVELPIL